MSTSSPLSQRLRQHHPYQHNVNHRFPSSSNLPSPSTYTVSSSSLVSTASPASISTSRLVRLPPVPPLPPPAARLANPVNHVPRDASVGVSGASSHEPGREQHGGFQEIQYSAVESESRSNRDTLPQLRRKHSEKIKQERQRQRQRQRQEYGQNYGAMSRFALGLNGTKALEEDNVQMPDQARVAPETYNRQTSQLASVPTSGIGKGTGVTRADTTVTGTGETTEDVGEELAWGPAHPCFPHMNPHVPVDSKEYLTTRIIRVKRDWMIRGDLAPTFSNTYPEILDPSLPEQEFRGIIATVNRELIEAFNPFSLINCFDVVLGLLTGWLWEDIGATGIKRRLRHVEEWLDKWNKEVGSKEGVRIWSLRRTAYLTLDIEIPDPKVGIIHSNAPSMAGSRPNTAG